MEQPTEPPTGDTPSAPSAPTAPAAAPLSFGQRLSAAYDALGGVGSNAELTSLRSQVETLTAAATAATATISRLETELAAANARIQDADGAVAAFEARVRSASIAAVAAAGIPTEELPKVAAAGEDPATKLRAELAALPLNDSVRRGEIAGKLMKLRNGNN